MDAPYRVVVTGAESTGKTTLAVRLGERLGAPVMGELLRKTVDAAGRLPTADDLEEVARSHAILDERLRRSDNEIVVYDTDLATIVVYWRRYFGDCPPWLVSEAIARAPDRYLLMADDIPWVPDAQRDGPQTRTELQRVFETWIPKLGRTAEISGTREEREHEAIRVIHADLAALGRDTPDRGDYSPGV